MKNIFRKNQVIITALAIMIVVAGYLNFSEGANTDALGEKQAQQGEDEVLQTSADLEGSILNSDSKDIIDESMLDISDEDIVKQANSENEQGESDQKENKSDKEKVSEDDKNTNDGENEDNKKVSESTNSEAGEAVLANNVVTGDFFANAKLNREQTRARNKETILGMIDNSNISEKQKQELIDQMINMTAISEKENATETVLQAKGYDGVVVSMVDGNVDVLVNKPELTKQDIVQIENVVKKKTGVSVENIVITPIETEK